MDECQCLLREVPLSITMIRLKRAYEPPSDQDGVRILVDRLWPRGISKENAAIRLWFKEVAPSVELRKWFSHDYTKWEEFRERYWGELNDNIPTIQKIREMASRGDITLIFSARDVEHNSAVILREYLVKSTNHLQEGRLRFESSGFTKES